MITKSQASIITGGLTQTSKMPCKSYSLPTIACKTGFRMSRIAGSICANCYANKGNYIKYQNNIEPVQHARLISLSDPLWIDAMVTLIGKDKYFRWHDSGDIQDIDHLEKIAEVARRTPRCRHWLPTREYGIVAAFTAQYDIPKNLIIRLSAMFVDQAVKVPASLQGIANVAVSNVHKTGKAIGKACPAYTRGGACGTCRSCWNNTAVSYPLH